jgi:hypothetical protein
MAFIAVAPDFHPELFCTSCGKKPIFFPVAGTKLECTLSELPLPGKTRGDFFNH